MADWAKQILGLGFVVLLLLSAPQVQAQGATTASGKELVAVLDFAPEGARKAEALAVSDRMREALLKTGKYTLVDRSQLDAVLNEQALQQTGCTNEECAVKVGKLLGVRRMVTGSVTKINDTLWYLSAKVIDVETAETLRAESVTNQDTYVTLLENGVAQLAAKISGTSLAGPAAPTGVGEVFISSDPAGASITLDGVVLKDKTDALVDKVPAGNHTIALSKDNLIGTQTFTLKAGELQRLSVKLEPATSALLVASKPFNAAVTLDGRNVGQTPVRADTTAGRHHVVVQLEWYTVFSQDVDLAPGESARVDATLSPAGKLRLVRLSSEDQVLIDGRTADTSQGELLLAPGTHHVRVTSPGRIPKEADAVVRFREVTSLDVSQVPIVGMLSVSGAPAGASVTLQGGQYINTRLSRTLPVDVSLPVGTYTVIVESHGFAPVTRQVDIRANQSQTINVDLRKMRPGKVHITVSPSGSVLSFNGEVVSRDGSYSAEVVPGEYDVQITHPSGNYVPVHQTVQVREDQELDRTYKLDETAQAKRSRGEAVATTFFVLGGITMTYGFFDMLAGAVASCPYDGQASNTLTAKQKQDQKDCTDKNSAQVTQGAEILLGGTIFLIIGAAAQPSGVADAEPPKDYVSFVPCISCTVVPGKLSVMHRF